MKIILRLLALLYLLSVPAYALEIEAPKVPYAGEVLMPEETESITEAIGEIIKKALSLIQPNVKEAAQISACMLTIVLIISLVEPIVKGSILSVRLASVCCITLLLMESTNTLIILAGDTILELSSYGKLLLPVMTTALAAQGGAGESAGLYLGTAFFDMLLSGLLADVFLPLVYLFLAFAVGSGAVGSETLKKMKNTTKGFITWGLKTLITVFITFMGITGVVSGTTDAAALKATRLTISSFVPVVGGILSDASEAVLVGAGIMKNAAGIYGILAVLSLFVGTFFRIGLDYLILKGSSQICGIFGSKPAAELIDDFSSAMGLLLGMVGAMCLLVLVSTVCFMKGMN